MSELKRKTPLRKKAFAEREIKPETKQPRKKTCAICKEKFQPMHNNLLAKVCSVPCSIEYAKQIRLKKERKEDRERKQKLKTKRDYLSEAQESFNRYVRLKSIRWGYNCISSGEPLPRERIGGGFDCGHYRSVGSAPHLRFHLHNAWGQSKHDNRYLAGNAVEYRRGLIERIGIERVEALEANNKIRKFSIEYLKRIKKIFDKKAKRVMRHI